MERSRARHGRVKAAVCLGVVVLLTLGAKRARAAEQLAPLGAPLVLEESESDPGVVVYPARLAGARPITVVLHGMCGAPEHACSHFADKITETDNLICPRAREHCAGGGSSWPRSGFAEQIAAAVARGAASLPAAADESHGRTLIGYSLGGFRALEIAQQSAGQYPRVMLIGARVFPQYKLLHENGVERLLFAAGEQDMTHDHMRQQSQRLSQAGLSARFLGLGPVGHFFTPSFAEYLPLALDWLRG